MSYSPWGHKELDMTEHTCTHTQYSALYIVVLLLLSRKAVSDSFATPWALVLQAPLSTGFPFMWTLFFWSSSFLFGAYVLVIDFHLKHILSHTPPSLDHLSFL